jgi:hypothetical protein
VTEPTQTGLPAAIITRRGRKTRIECPHCGKQGSDNFYYVEDILSIRELVGFKSGVLLIRSHYDVADDGDNGRLACRACDQECLIPDDVEYDWR